MQPLLHRSPWDRDDVVEIPRALPSIPQALDFAQTLVPGAANASDEERANAVIQFLDALDGRAAEFAHAVERDTGRLADSCRREVDGTIRAMRIVVAAWVSRSKPSWAWARGVAREVDRPLGLVLAITPGNFPFSAFLRKTVSALLAGCVIVIKTSERAPRTSLLFKEVMPEDGGLPAIVVLGGAEEASALLSAGAFSAVSFTGSTAIGKRVAASTDRMSVELQIEAGGKNFCLVDEGIRLQSVLPQVLQDAWNDAGQSCVATSRLIVVTDSQRAAFNQIEEVVAAEVEHSGPLLFGGLMSRQAASNAEEAIAEARAGGTVITRHGEYALPPEADPEAFLVPAVAWNADRETRIWAEDIFAPVLCVTAVPTFEDALRVAVDSRYGLAGSVFTDSASHVRLAAKHLNVGKLVINAPTRTGAPQIPMCGFGDSGAGPPENGLRGIEFFSRKQVVYELTED